MGGAPSNRSSPLPSRGTEEEEGGGADPSSSSYSLTSSAGAGGGERQSAAAGAGAAGVKQVDFPVGGRGSFTPGSAYPVVYSCAGHGGSVVPQKRTPTAKKPLKRRRRDTDTTGGGSGSMPPPLISPPGTPNGSEASSPASVGQDDMAVDGNVSVVGESDLPSSSLPSISVAGQVAADEDCSLARSLLLQWAPMDQQLLSRLSASNIWPVLDAVYCRHVDPHFAAQLMGLGGEHQEGAVDSAFQHTDLGPELQSVDAEEQKQGVVHVLARFRQLRRGDSGLKMMDGVDRVMLPVDDVPTLSPFSIRVGAVDANGSPYDDGPELPGSLQVLRVWRECAALEESNPGAEGSIALAIEEAQKELRSLMAMNKVTGRKLLDLVEAEAKERFQTAQARHEEEQREKKLLNRWQLHVEEMRAKEEASTRRIHEDMEAECYVCGSGDSPHGDTIIFCDHCDIPVHQSCYSVSEIPEGNWYCYPCSVTVQKGLALEPLGPTLPTGDKGPHDISCALCPETGGAFFPCDVRLPPADSIAVPVDRLYGISGDKQMPEDEGKPDESRGWVHSACLRWVGLSPDSTGFARVSRFLRESANTFAADKACCIFCGQSTGALTRCSESRCNSYYHVSCGQRRKDHSVFVVKHRTKDWQSFCPRHSIAAAQRINSNCTASTFLPTFLNEESSAPRSRRAVLSSCSFCSTKTREFIACVCGEVYCNPCGEAGERTELGKLASCTACERSDKKQNGAQPLNPVAQRALQQLAPGDSKPKSRPVRHSVLRCTNTPPNGRRLCQICQRSSKMGLWACVGTRKGLPCTVVVHWRCYHRQAPPPSEGGADEEIPFLCDLCSAAGAKGHDNGLPLHPPCALCPMLGGPMKPIEGSDGWIHALCALACPSLMHDHSGPVSLPLPDASTGDATEGVADTPSLLCWLCEGPACSPGGLGLVNCSEKNCDMCVAHATCAARAGCSFIPSQALGVVGKVKRGSRDFSGSSPSSQLLLTCHRHRLSFDSITQQLRFLCKERYSSDLLSVHDSHLLVLANMDLWVRVLGQMACLFRTIEWEGSTSADTPVKRIRSLSRALGLSLRLTGREFDGAGCNGVPHGSVLFGAEVGAVLSSSLFGHFNAVEVKYLTLGLFGAYKMATSLVGFVPPFLPLPSSPEEYLPQIVAIPVPELRPDSSENGDVPSGSALQVVQPSSGRTRRGYVPPIRERAHAGKSPPCCIICAEAGVYDRGDEPSNPEHFIMKCNACGGWFHPWCLEYELNMDSRVMVAPSGVEIPCSSAGEPLVSQWFCSTCSSQKTGIIAARS
jgi:hypothetical protein